MNSKATESPDNLWRAWVFICVGGLCMLGIVCVAGVIFYIILSNSNFGTQQKEAKQKTEVVNPRLLAVYIDNEWSTPYIKIKWSSPEFLDRNATITLQNMGPRDAMSARLVLSGKNTNYINISQRTETVIAHGRLKDALGMSSINISTVGKTQAALKIHFETDQNLEALKKTNVCIWWLEHCL